MRRGYGRGYGLFDLLFDGINAAGRYIADERREARGEAQRNTEYVGDISGSRGLDFAELLRADMEREKEMRESISIGDEVITIGGIIGLVVRQTDDTLVIETGGDRSKLRIQKSAVKENVTARERMQAAAVEEKKNAGPDKTEKSKKES